METTQTEAQLKTHFALPKTEANSQGKKANQEAREKPLAKGPTSVESCEQVQSNGRGTSQPMSQKARPINLRLF
jgi:3-deoxy-D-arabino-heptulosonate 7-phosphate (DAHP) synthase